MLNSGSFWALTASLYLSKVAFNVLASVPILVAISSSVPSTAKPFLTYPSAAFKFSLISWLNIKNAEAPFWSNIALETTSLVWSSSINLLPSLFTRIAPSPLTDSVIILVFLCTTVGWVWIWSISIKAPPTFSIITIPSPTIAGLLVEPKPFNFGLYFSTILGLAPNPPVATITAFALITYSSPLASLTFTPTILLLFLTKAIAFVPFLISILSFSAVLASPLTTTGPTATPPVGLCILFTLCPPL